jgi:outer membrane immunogenic protein
MKNTISAVALLAALVSGSAFAADLPSRKGPPPVYVPPPPVFTWTGLYAGLNLGGVFADNNNDNNNFFFFNNNSGNRSGVVGGGQIGYNFALTPLFVAGIETDFQGTSARDLQWFGTVRGRLGITPFDPHLLVYGTGGFAYGEVRSPFTGFTDVRTGWTAGGGVEWAFLPNWSAKVEYLYTDLSSNNDNNTFFFNPVTGALFTPINRHRKFHTVRAGVNYHFNFWQPAPVLAKY